MSDSVLFIAPFSHYESLCTSVFGGMFYTEFREPSQSFFAEVDSGRFTLFTSAIVEAEIEPAPKDIREFFNQYLRVAELINPTKDAIKLQQAYIKSGVVTEKSADDALHVALATVVQCGLIISWNFKHIELSTSIRFRSTMR